MNDTSREESPRDRGRPYRYPWWLLLVGFAFGVFVTLIVTQGQMRTVTVYQPQMPPDDFLRTATAFVGEATLAVQAPANTIAPLDPLLATATALVQQANGEEFARGADPISMTATALVAQATQQAGR